MTISQSAVANPEKATCGPLDSLGAARHCLIPSSSERRLCGKRSLGESFASALYRPGSSDQRGTAIPKLGKRSTSEDLPLWEALMTCGAFKTQASMQSPPTLPLCPKNRDKLLLTDSPSSGKCFSVVPFVVWAFVCRFTIPYTFVCRFTAPSTFACRMPVG